MINPFERLDYEDHLREVRIFISGKNEEEDANFTHQAQDMHAGSVNDAVLSTSASIMKRITDISNRDARDYATYGVLRRLQMIWASLRSVRSTAPPDRTVPLSLEQTTKLSVELNAIYINFIGAVDNVAWVLREEIGSEQTRRLNPMQVGMDSPRFLADNNFQRLADALSQYREWLHETKTRRNPAAHRIPLSTPPIHLPSADEAQARADIEQELRQCFDTERRKVLHERINKIGTFVPVFLHKPNEGIFPIYPTVPQDIANLVKIVRAGFACLPESVEH